jgi:hypothetical protein
VTLLLAKRDMVAGYPAMEVRRMLRVILSCHGRIFPHEPASAKWAEKWLRPPVPLGQLIAVFLCEGLLQPSEEEKGAYELTDKGRAVAQSKACKPITRRTGNEAIEGLLQRAKAVNSDRQFVKCVDALVLFGSFVTQKARPSDVDVAFKLRPRWTDKEEQDRRERECISTAMRGGRHFQNIVDELSWPDRKVELYLRNRVRCLSFQDWHTFLRLRKKDSGQPYRVLLGDEDEVVAGITAAEKQQHE